MTKGRLAVKDWLEAAFRALTNGGPSAIKAEAIARDLGVSKGSFYWHFENVPALKSNMLSHWEEVATQAIITDLNHRSDTPEHKLQRLLLISTSVKEGSYGGKLVEAAIRDWGKYDKAVNKAIQQVDAARIEYVEGLFQQAGLKKKQSKSYARILYAALIGAQILSEHKHVNPEQELNELLTILLD